MPKRSRVSGSRSFTSHSSRRGHGWFVGRRKISTALSCAINCARRLNCGTNRGRPEDLLWTGSSFKEFELWRERYPGGLAAMEIDFSDAMVRRASDRKRRRRLALAAFVGVLVAVLEGRRFKRFPMRRRSTNFARLPICASWTMTLRRQDIGAKPVRFRDGRTCGNAALSFGSCNFSAFGAYHSALRPSLE